MFESVWAKQDLETGIKPLGGKGVPVAACADNGVLVPQCGTALGCAVALAEQELFAWSTTDCFGASALINVSPTATSPSSHSRAACCCTSGITVHSRL